MSLTLKKNKTTNARIGMNMKTELIQGAIFDMDGTLLDSMPVWEHASERYLQNKGIEVREKLSEILFSMSMQKGAEYVKENYHLTESTDEIVTGVNNIVYTAYEKEVQPKEGVREFLDKLQAEGIKMVVATSTDRPMVEAALKRTGLLNGYLSARKSAKEKWSRTFIMRLLISLEQNRNTRWCLKMHFMRSGRRKKPGL